jgi:uncharacterized protein (TIGR00369 family)
MSARERRVVWEDVEVYRPSYESKSGLEFLTELAERKLPNPPMFELLGFRVASVAEGEVNLEGVSGEHLYNPAGVVHGGYLATLIDTATALSVRSCQPVGARITSVDLKVSFVRPLTSASGDVRCEGRVTHLGRKISFAEAVVKDARDKIIATGSASLISL